MKNVFIDTSALAAILFSEPGHSKIHRFLENFEKVYAANLLEAEMRAAALREGVDQRMVDEALTRVDWILPDRPLSQELRAIAACGVPLRGAVAWHLAAALFIAGDPSTFPFMTLDGTQALAADRLGFKVLPGGGTLEIGIHESRATYRVQKNRTRHKNMKLRKT